MPQFDGYYQDASPKERKQLDKINDEILKLKSELAKVTSASSGNFEKIGSVLGKTTDEARTIGRQAAATTLRTKRQELERQLGSLQRQRQGFEQGVLTRKAGEASEAIAKFVPADKNKAAAVAQDPVGAQQNFLSMNQQFQQAVQDPNLPYDAKLKMFVDLRKEAAFVDLANGKIKGLNDTPGEGTMGALVMAKPNIDAIRASRPMGLEQIVQSGTVPAIPGVGGGVQPLNSADSMNPSTVQAAQGLQESLRSGSPMPAVVTGANADELSFAQRQGRSAMQAPAGQQLTFRNTGPSGQIEAGYAPVGAKDPFSQMTQGPKLQAQLQGSGLGNNAASPFQLPGIPPPGPVTNPSGMSISNERFRKTGSPVVAEPGEPPQAATMFGQLAPRDYQRIPLTGRDTLRQFHGEQAGAPLTLANPTDWRTGATNQLIRVTERATGKTGWVNSVQFNPRDHVAAPLEGPPQPLIPPSVPGPSMPQPQAQPVAQSAPPSMAPPPGQDQVVLAYQNRVGQALKQNPGNAPALIQELQTKGIDPRLFPQLAPYLQ